MDTTDTILVSILTALLSIFFIMCIAVTVGVFKLVTVVRRVVDKAEDVIDSVESAAEVLKDTSGRLAFLKLLRNIMKLAQRSSK